MLGRLVLPSRLMLTWDGSGSTPASSASPPSFVGNMVCLFFFLPAPTLAICLPVFSIGFEHESLWSKPIPILGGCSHLLGCSRLPFIHLLQHLCIFPDLHVVFLDQQLGFKSREDYVSLLASNIYGDCIY